MSLPILVRLKRVPSYRQRGLSGGDFVVEYGLQIAFLFPKFTKEQEKTMMEMKLKQLEQEQQQSPQPKK